jgi:hypothetical protein
VKKPVIIAIIINEMLKISNIPLAGSETVVSVYHDAKGIRMLYAKFSIPFPGSIISPVASAIIISIMEPIIAGERMSKIVVNTIRKMTTLSCQNPAM